MSDIDEVEERVTAVEEIVTQYLTFCLHTHVVGVPLTAVKEVMGIKAITLLPRTPEFVRGVINLRGQIIPLIDLKLKFGMGKCEFTVDSCIIIIEVHINEQAILIGALADSVRDVVTSQGLNVDPAPKMGAAMDSKFILGMQKNEDEFFTILDISVLFSIEELLVGADTNVVSASIL
ncbi:chemotaxis protein CheW [Colwellia piezophila]|uniref:chemotaxis protein CheW n=1 Tax=Colwellia piezophila TaxID=211668 RepID=UPI000369D793|nr:chemotaxis protein CheW [Colwellia piezophila]